MASNCPSVSEKGEISKLATSKTDLVAALLTVRQAYLTKPSCGRKKEVASV